MVTVYCNICENNQVFASGKCKSCYNKNYWANATEEMLEKRRLSVAVTNRRQKDDNYIPRALRPKQSKEEKSKKAVICNRNRKLIRRQFLDDIKLKSGCIDCGYKERAIALDFDHVRGQKEFNIARAMASLRPFELILEEVSKCDVRCANCHRVVTEDRKNGKLFF
jgi:hypothetical protein